MRYRTILIFLSAIFAVNICIAQTNDAFRKMQDSVYAMQYMQNLQPANKKPVFYSGATTAKVHLKNTPLTNIVSRTATICFDTSRRSFVINDTAFFYTRDPYPAADGSYLLSGQYVSIVTPNLTGGFLVKLDHKGNVLWHRNYRWQSSPGYTYINYQRVMELQDGSILLTGRTTGDPVTGNDHIIFTKTDMLGNVIWSKMYRSRLWTNGNGSADYYYVQQMKQDPASGDIFITGPTWAKGRTMMKMDPANGNIAWSKRYYSADANDNPLGLEIKADRVRLFSRMLVFPNVVMTITDINKATGDTIACTYRRSVDIAGINVGLLGNDPLTVLNNGHYVLSGKSFGNFIFPPGSTNYYQASVIEFDNNLNFVRAYNFRNAVESNSYNSRVSVSADGSVFFSMLHYISGYTADIYSVQVRQGQIAKQRMKRTQVSVPYEPIAVKAPDGGDLLMRLVGDTSDNINKIELLNMHVSDTSSACMGITVTNTYLYPFNVQPMQFSTWIIEPDIFQETINHAIVSVSLADHYLPGCIQVSHCDTIKLLASATILCPTQTLQLTGRKNPECGSNITWQYNSAGISSAQQPNDSTLILGFSGAWSGYIYGSIYGCSVITDSVFITVLQTPPALNLGADFSICPQNTRLLNAHTGYASYRWQDASTDSTFLVTQPGTYYVDATDACGVTSTDTVHVTAHAPVLVSIGPDRSKCNNDTIMLQAPAGFLSYNWMPNYNINALNMPVAVVNPAVDTSYIVKVEAEPGCFGFDTVKINVLHSPPISLGNDTSFCSGGSITMFAGPGFNSYAWSTGSISSQVTVNQAGEYSVMATTLQGCKSTDTLKVLQVYVNPIVMLDPNDKLCQGSTKILDAGAFSTWRWQNGATTRTLAVNNTGVYYVDVTDNHGCKGSDTSRINTILPLPANFLPAGTSKCNYEKITLKASQAYPAYLWSDNSTANAITISNPGLYWLAVTDIDGCTGRDSIVITQRQCLKGLFVPTAFTPNTDRTNDELKALLFGTVKSFVFRIFNRYGQLVFYTTDVNAGWNGKYKGQKQDYGTFVWQCRYQLEGEAVKEESGSFILLR